MRNTSNVMGCQKGEVVSGGSETVSEESNVGMEGGNDEQRQRIGGDSGSDK